MKQFATQWPEIIRRAKKSGLIEVLAADCESLLNAPLQIPQTGIASWTLYYFCPEHSVRLIWDRNLPLQHCCPVDGHVFSGEPYDSAWWREMNDRNASACQQLGLLWQLTGDQRYLQKVRNLLMGYADVYPDYEVHGNIPHNGPGKMNAQTLCEANCLLEMALGYDCIADNLTDSEKQHISDNLLRCAATFLQQHRSPQIHNHEVKINAALAVLGFILDDEALLDFAVNQQYGLRWQLENALLEEGLWFEGSIHYHYYALQGFFAFEKLALGTRWSLTNGPWYPKMLDFPLSLLLPDGTFPRLNDCLAGQEKLEHLDVYEFAWHVWKEPRYASVLKHGDEPGEQVNALLWRDVPLPVDCPPLIPTESIFSPSAGITLWRSPEQHQAVLIKHTPFGGEHDHYDRLSLNIWRNGGWWLPDLGTTGYGAKMHYDYYKNTAAHNTITINQTNQPPSTPYVLGTHQGDGWQWLDCEVDWGQPAPVLNSHTRVEWDKEAWRDVRFRRQLLWWDDLLIDVSHITNPHLQQIDWTLHLAAQPLDQIGVQQPFSLIGPLRHMRNSTMIQLQGCQPRHFTRNNETFALWLSGKAELWQGNAPDNPSINDLSYLVLRSHKEQARFVSIWDFSEATPLTEVNVLTEHGNTQILLHRTGKTQRVTVPLEGNTLPELK